MRVRVQVGLRLGLQVWVRVRLCLTMREPTLWQLEVRWQGVAPARGLAGSGASQRAPLLASPRWAARVAGAMQAQLPPLPPPLPSQMATARWRLKLALAQPELGRPLA